MKSIDEKAIETFSNWNIAFNSRDVEKQISYMHFPCKSIYLAKIKK